MVVLRLKGWLRRRLRVVAGVVRYLLAVSEWLKVAVLGGLRRWLSAVCELRRWLVVKFSLSLLG